MVELLIVIAMLGILAAAGISGYRQLWVRAQLNSAVTTFETELERARRVAKSEDRPVDFAVTSVAGEWRVSSDGRTAELGSAQFSAEVELTLLPPFGTLNLATAEGTSVTVSVGDRAFDIDVVGVLARTVVSR